jgi:hypothetical protein
MSRGRRPAGRRYPPFLIGLTWDWRDLDTSATAGQVYCSAVFFIITAVKSTSENNHFLTPSVGRKEFDICHFISFREICENGNLLLACPFHSRPQCWIITFNWVRRKLDQMVMILTWMLEVFVSNINGEIGFPYWGFSWFTVSFVSPYCQRGKWI